jgi:hypothetical protein
VIYQQSAVPTVQERRTSFGATGRVNRLKLNGRRHGGCLILANASDRGIKKPRLGHYSLALDQFKDGPREG